LGNHPLAYHPLLLVTFLKGDFNPVGPGHWPLVLALTASGYLSMVKAAFPPALAVGLFMEAVISMSKIDAATIKFTGGVLH
jgi:hypothetical protein